MFVIVPFRWLEGFRRVDRWAHLYPDRQWVSVNDREGDISEVLREAIAPGRRAGLLVRARHDRSLLGPRRQTLFKYLRRLPEAGVHTVRVTLWRGLQRLNDIVASWEIFAPHRHIPRRAKPRRQKTPQRFG